MQRIHMDWMFWKWQQLFNNGSLRKYVPHQILIYFNLRKVNLTFDISRGENPWKKESFQYQSLKSTMITLSRAVNIHIFFSFSFSFSLFNFSLRLNENMWEPFISDNVYLIVLDVRLYVSVAISVEVFEEEKCTLKRSRMSLLSSLGTNLSQFVTWQDNFLSNHCDEGVIFYLWIIYFHSFILRSMIMFITVQRQVKKFFYWQVSRTRFARQNSAMKNFLLEK